jgi:hypothetical protein
MGFDGELRMREMPLHGRAASLGRKALFGAERTEVVNNNSPDPVDVLRQDRE